MGVVCIDLKKSLNLYDVVKDDMKFFINSDVRSKIMLSLQDGSKNLASIRNDLNFSSSTILHGIYLLEDKKLVFKDGGKYHLSQTGKLSALKLLNLMKSFSSMNKLENLLLDHEINVIPSKLLQGIECLENGYILESDTQNIRGPYDALAEKILNSEKVNFVSSVYYPFYLDIFRQSNDMGGDMQLILTNDILDTIFKEFNDEIKNLNRANVGLWQINDNLNLSLFLADEFIALGLFLENGVYDSDRFLISEGKEAVNWGNRLFKHYFDQASPVKL